MYSGVFTIGAATAIIVVGGLLTYACFKFHKTLEVLQGRSEQANELLLTACGKQGNQLQSEIERMQTEIERVQKESQESIATERKIRVAAITVLLDALHTNDQDILTTLADLHKRSIEFVQSNILSINTSRAETDEKIIKAADSISSAYFLVEHSLRELRGRLPQVPSDHKLLDICSKCSRPATQYFVDGTGATICMNCNKEGFLEAVRRGTAKI